MNPVCLVSVVLVTADTTAAAASAGNAVPKGLGRPARASFPNHLLRS